MPLTEDIALVTGASRGIGQAIALGTGQAGRQSGRYGNDAKGCRRHSIQL